MPISMKRIVIIFLALICGVASASPVSLRGLDRAAQAARQGADLRQIDIYRNGLTRTLDFVRANTQIFPDKPVAESLLTDAAKVSARATWKTFLDYQRSLEGIEQFHGDFYLLVSRSARERSLGASYAAHSARYAAALQFIARAENNPALAKILNESLGDLGLEAGAYDRFKFHFLNVAQGSQFAALSALHKASAHKDEAAFAAALASDTATIWQMARGKGVAMTIANAMNVVKGLGQRAVFPAQAGISEWMGDTKVLRPHRALISDAQIVALTAKMQPGDVMIQRREWYVSNVGLPGFWSHAALFIGTAELRRAYFNDPDVSAWVRSEGVADGELETLLRTRYPEAYQKAITRHAHNHAPRVLEAISEGVSFTTMEHSAAADSVGVMRPRLSKKDIAIALLRAFAYAGRPYDFDFDFQTDQSLVCTELVYKAYEPSSTTKGITMVPQTIVGRLAIPANEYAISFDREFGSALQQWDLISFLDGNERQKRAVEEDVAQFRQSWKRPKWHVLLPDTRAPKAQQ